MAAKKVPKGWKALVKEQSAHLKKEGAGNQTSKH